MTIRIPKFVVWGILLVNATAQAAIPVAADDKFLADACKRINVRQGDVIMRACRIRLDTSQVRIGVPTDSVHGQSTEKFYSVDALSYVAFCNSHLVNGGEFSLKVLSIDVQTGDGGVMAEAPVFIFKLRAVDGAGHEYSVTKGASGPSFSDWSFRRFDRNPTRIRSANIVCLGAFLSTIIALNEAVSAKS
jgi:hypothetical protein